MSRDQCIVWRRCVISARRIVGENVYWEREIAEKICHYRLADIKASTDQEVRLFSTARFLRRLNVRLEHAHLRTTWCSLPVDCKYTELLSSSMEGYTKRWPILVRVNGAGIDVVRE